MRRTISAALSAAAVMATLALVSAPAEAADIRCHVPFSFQVHGTTLPAGDYTFSAEPGELFVRGYRHSAFALTIGEQSTSDTGAKAVFERRGDEYVLRDVWVGGGVGREVVRPPTIPAL
jgi:opacity protein-like surface antigen